MHLKARVTCGVGGVERKGKVKKKKNRSGRELTRKALVQLRPAVRQVLFRHP